MLAWGVVEDEDENDLSNLQGDDVTVYSKRLSVVRVLIGSNKGRTIAAFVAGSTS